MTNPVIVGVYNGETIAYASQQSGDIYPRFVLDSFGSMYFGDGTSDPTLGTNALVNIQYVPSPYSSTVFLNVLDASAGSFLVINDNSGYNFISVANSGLVELGSSNQIQIDGGPGDATNNYVGLELTATGNINMYVSPATGSANIDIAGAVTINETSAGVSTLGFFGHTPVAEQVSGGTLAGVIAGLVALGLFSS